MSLTEIYLWSSPLAEVGGVGTFAAVWALRDGPVRPDRNQSGPIMASTAP